MRTWEPAFIGAKLVAVIVLAFALEDLPSVVQYTTQGGSFDGSRVAGIARIALMLALAALLWFRADRFADLVSDHVDVSLPDEADAAPPQNTPDRSDMTMVGLALIGAYLAATAIPAFASHLLEGVFPTSFPGGTLDTPFRRANLFAAGTQALKAAIGLWMVVNGRAIALVVDRMHRPRDAD